MRVWVAFLSAGLSCGLYGQVYNRLLTFKASYTAVQLDQQNIVSGFNDTSEFHHFELVTQMPYLAYNHEVLLGNVLSVTGNIGWQYLNVFYDHKPFGTQFFALSLEPKLCVFQRKKFEYYFKLKAGVTVWTHKKDLVDGPTRRLFPDRVNLFTGITLAGMNLFLNDNWGINCELSILSPEMVSLGMCYRFWRGDLPKIQGEEEEEEKK